MWLVLFSARNFLWRFFIVSTRNRFCIFFFVIVCFFPVVIRHASSLEKNALTLLTRDLSVYLLYAFLSLKVLRFFEKPSAVSDHLCSLYFLTIFPTTTSETVFFPCSFRAFLYFHPISEIKALWCSKVLLTLLFTVQFLSN